MEPIVVNATDLRIRAREIMERVKYHREHFLVQTFGQPTAMIISVDEYQRLLKCAQGKIEGPMDHAADDTEICTSAGG